MNGSKSYGPSGDPQTSGEVPTRLALRASFPHPGPLPRGEGESSAGFQHNPARCLPDEPPEQPNLPPAVPSPRGRGPGWAADRIAVRYSDSAHSRNCRTLRVLRQSRFRALGNCRCARNAEFQVPDGWQRFFALGLGANCNANAALRASRFFELALSETPSTKPQAPGKFRFSSPKNRCRANGAPVGF